MCSACTGSTENQCGLYEGQLMVCKHHQFCTPTSGMQKGGGLCSTNEDCQSGECHSWAGIGDENKYCTSIVGEPCNTPLNNNNQPNREHVCQWDNDRLMRCKTTQTGSFGVEYHHGTVFRQHRPQPPPINHPLLT
jgi:hypothetical protein